MVIVIRWSKPECTQHSLHAISGPKIVLHRLSVSQLNFFMVQVDLEGSCAELEAKDGNDEAEL